MKNAEFKIKKSIKAQVTATSDKVKIKFAKQCLGTIGIWFTTQDGHRKLLRQTEVWIHGDKLTLEVL